MRPIAFALTVVLAAPLAAAQSEEPESPAEVPTEPAAAPSEIRLAPLSVHSSSVTPETHRTLRIAINPLLVPVGGFAGGTVGALIGVAIGARLPNNGGLFAGLDNAFRGGLVGGAIAVALATPATAVLIGHYTGGRGHYGWTLLGTLAGASVGSALTYALSYATDDSPWAFVPLFVFATAGTILAYEMSSDAASAPDRRSAQRVQLLPVVGRALGGETTLGLMGVF
jgi:hypothetical protein